jgi:hypothetical protein
MQNKQETKNRKRKETKRNKEEKGKHICNDWLSLNVFPNDRGKKERGNLKSEEIDRMTNRLRFAAR